jgi:hypothetical protein
VNDEAQINPIDHESDFIAKSIRAIEEKISFSGYEVRQNTNFYELRDYINSVNAYDSPIFDPDEHDLRNGAFWLQVVTKEGETIASHAERMFSCRDFVTEFIDTDLIWFEKTAKIERSTWRTKIQHPPTILDGNVSIAGSMFVKKEHRGTGLSLYLPHLSRSIFMNRFGTNWNTGLVRENILNSRIPTEYYGYPRTALLFSGTLPRTTGAFTDIHLCWISRSESIEQIRRLGAHTRYPVNVD